MTTPSTPKPRIAAPSLVRSSLRSGLKGGAVGAVVSALVNYLLVGVPDSAAANAANHAVSGLISGFAAAFFGLLAHQRKAASVSQPGGVVDDGAEGPDVVRTPVVGRDEDRGTPASGNGA
ncbi:hypothetical protein [Streptomyces sp. NPDC047061]|uniref:hypothetical protein n=1 Tax=Streptomyces sp. NPDC047061 TaxID=3154605 RepID=UPI003411F0EB